MNATRTDCRRSAFTLIELLVVVGLMAMLATVSIAGYSAASRGMADRGAVQSAISTLRVALQTCLMDRVPTKVLFFTQLLKSGDTDSATLYQGTAIAIKQAGRITVKPGATGVGTMLVDEFADWNLSYPASGRSGNSGMLIFRMASRDESKGIDGCSSSVTPFVTKKDIVDDYMIQTGTTIRKWCDVHAPGNDVMWGLEIRSGLTDWKSGDPYGVEIARIDLPRGYIFGKSPPTDNKLKAASVAAVTFDPEDPDPSMSGSVPISLMRPNKEGKFEPKQVGDPINADMLKDTFK